MSVRAAREKIRNTAYILLLIREGKVSSFADLCGHFGLRPAGIDSLGYLLRESLMQLKTAQLIDYTEVDYFTFTQIRVLPLLEQIQNSLDISVAELAASSPDNRLIVSPNFSKWSSGKYKSDIFVLMPFSPTLDPLYQDHLKSVTAKLNLTIARADDFFTNAEIMTEIWSAISGSRLVIADCTDRNPNVFYEIGLAHAIGKDVILIAQSQDDVPFDLRHRRYIEYEFTPRGMKKFEETIAKTIQTVLDVSPNPGPQADS